MIPDHLRLHPSQQTLTPEQEAAARRFAQARITAQLSTEPVDELEIERLLLKAYARGGHLSPQHIHWVDGPLQLDRALASMSAVTLRYESMWDDVWENAEDHLSDSYRGMVYVPDSYREKDEEDNLWPIDWKLRVSTGVLGRVRALVWACVWENVGHGLENGMYASDDIDVDDSVQASVRAYTVAHRLALHHFFDEYQEPNSLHALARFNERVSGYWLGKKEAIIVRCPGMRSCDA